jgi:DivIVA domain-containing protein
MTRGHDEGMTGDASRAVTFPQSLRGYAPHEVDAVLDRIADRIEQGGRIDLSWLAAVSFRTTFRGYSTRAVDAFLQTAPCDTVVATASPMADGQPS